MNRSLANVILGGYGVSKGPAMAVEGEHTETDSNHVVEMLTGARDVIIVPGELFYVRAQSFQKDILLATLDEAHCLAVSTVFVT